MAKRSKKIKEVVAVTPEPVVSENKVVEIDPVMRFFSTYEQDRILAFINNGLPGVSRLDDMTMSRIQDLYIEGFSFYEIANKLRIKNDIVFYYAYKHKLPEVKNNRLKETSSTIVEKYQIARLDSASFVSELIQFWHEYYRDKIESFRKTKDQKIVDTMDLKHLDKYFKAVELLEKMMGKPESAPQSPVISLPEGGTVSSDGNTITVTPDSKSETSGQDVGEVLRLLAELKLAQKDK